MANDLNFYYTDDGTNLPLDINNGNLYFILTEDKDIASLFLDIEDKRYEIKPIIEEATIEKAGLLSKDDKKKLVSLKIESRENPRKVEIGVNSQEQNKTINFSDYVYIKNDQILTANSIQKVTVEPIIPHDDNQPVEASASITPIEGQDGKFYLKLILPIPKGDRGPEGPEGPQGRRASIRNVTAKIDTENGIIETDNQDNISTTVNVETTHNNEDNSTDFNFNFPLIKGRTGDKGDKGDTGPRGKQGHMADVEFRFNSTSGKAFGEVTKLSEDGVITDEGTHDSIVKYIYDIYVPRGEKGDAGRPFRIDHSYSSVAEMEAARNNEELNYGDFILIENTNQIDETVGELYYYSYNRELVYLTDMSPVQPEFKIDENSTETLNSDENAEVSVYYINDDYTKPYLKFKIPRGYTGKSLLPGTSSISVDKKIGTPSASLEMTTTSNPDDTDEKYLNLNLGLNNLGTDININASVNNSTGQPGVSVTKTIVNDDTPTFNFAFTGLKGEKGTAADTFATRLITANYDGSTSLNNGNPYAHVDAFQENNQLGLHFTFANLKGEDGNLGAIELAGDGNAITNIENSGNNGIKVTKGNTFITSSEFNSYVNDVSWFVNKGGTGRNSFTLNAVLIGNGTNPIEEVQSKTGAFYSDGTNNEPRFGTLPVDKGGTGVTGFKPNSLLVSGPPDVVGGNTSTKINTLYNENGVLIRDNGSIGFSNTLPVEYGGLGIDETVPNTVMTVNGYGDISFESQLSVDKGGTGRDYFEPCLLAGAGLDPITYIESQVGALYFSGESNNYPEFGILPVELGGTGATNFQDALTELGALHGEIWEIEDDDYCLGIDGVFSS